MSLPALAAGHTLRRGRLGLLSACGAEVDASACSPRSVPSSAAAVTTSHTQLNLKQLQVEAGCAGCSGQFSDVGIPAERAAATVSAEARIAASRHWLSGGGCAMLEPVTAAAVRGRDAEMRAGWGVGTGTLATHVPVSRCIARACLSLSEMHNVRAIWALWRPAFNHTLAVTGPRLRLSFLCFVPIKHRL